MRRVVLYGWRPPTNTRFPRNVFAFDEIRPAGTIPLQWKSVAKRTVACKRAFNNALYANYPLFSQQQCIVRRGRFFSLRGAVVPIFPFPSKHNALSLFGDFRAHTHTQYNDDDDDNETTINPTHRRDNSHVIFARTPGPPPATKRNRIFSVSLLVRRLGRVPPCWC